MKPTVAKKRKKLFHRMFTWKLKTRYISAAKKNIVILKGEKLKNNKMNGKCQKKRKNNNKCNSNHPVIVFSPQEVKWLVTHRDRGRNTTSGHGCLTKTFIIIIINGIYHRHSHHHHHRHGCPLAVCVISSDNSTAS